MKVSLGKDLAPVKSEAKKAIDASAEEYRLNFITPGAGQAMTYQEKYNEAVAFLGDPTLQPHEVPHIYSEVGVTGATPFQVAQVVVNMRDIWKQISARIDGARIAAKDAVDAAGNPADLASASQVDWTTHVL